MQHLGVNFRGIWRFELDFFICFFLVFLLKKSGLIFESPVAALPPTTLLAYAMWSIRLSCNAIIYFAMQTEHSSQFVKARQYSGLLNAKFTSKGTSPFNHLYTER